MVNIYFSIVFIFATAFGAFAMDRPEDSLVGQWAYNSLGVQGRISASFGDGRVIFCGKAYYPKELAFPKGPLVGEWAYNSLGMNGRISASFEDGRVIFCGKAYYPKELAFPKGPLVGEWAYNSSGVHGRINASFEDGRVIFRGKVCSSYGLAFENKSIKIQLPNIKKTSAEMDLENTALKMAQKASEVAENKAECSKQKKSISESDSSAQIQEEVVKPEIGDNCIVCFKNIREVIFLPCRHFDLCDECGSKKEIIKCPACRSEIKEKIKVIRS